MSDERNHGRDASPASPVTHSEVAPDSTCHGPVVSVPWARMAMMNARYGDVHNLVCGLCGYGVRGTPAQVEQTLASDRAYLRSDDLDNVADSPEFNP